MATRAKNRTKDEIFRILLLLEKNSMQISKTAKELCINRKLIERYKNQYWDEYKGQKKTVKAESLVIAQEKQAVLTEMNNFKDDLGKLQSIAVTKLIQHLNSAAKIPPHLLLDIIREVAPYLVEKMGVMGVNALNDLDPVTRHTTFVQNIINKMEIKNGNSSY